MLTKQRGTHRSVRRGSRGGSQGRGARSRCLRMQPLEDRRLLAVDFAGWQNLLIPTDVNNDGVVSPADLRLVAAISTYNGPRQLGNPGGIATLQVQGDSGAVQLGAARNIAAPHRCQWRRLLVRLPTRCWSSTRYCTTNRTVLWSPSAWRRSTPPDYRGQRSLRGRHVHPERVRRRQPPCVRAEIQECYEAFLDVTYDSTLISPPEA